MSLTRNSIYSCICSFRNWIFFCFLNQPTNWVIKASFILLCRFIYDPSEFLYSYEVPGNIPNLSALFDRLSLSRLRQKVGKELHFSKWFQKQLWCKGKRKRPFAAASRWWPWQGRSEKIPKNLKCKNHTFLFVCLFW